MVELIRRHDIKAPDSKELEIEALLQQPGVYPKIQAIAATLNDTFSVQTKLLIDLRPGAEFRDLHTNMDYIYEGTMVPYDFDALTTVILRLSMHPVEEMQDQGYALFREKAVNGKRELCALKDFIKMFSIDRWKVIDFNISDEREIAKNVIG